MTVIAWDGKILAADGRTTRGMDIVTDNATKIHSVEHPDFGELKGAFCGAVLVVNPWIDHIAENGFTPFELPDEEYSASGVFVHSNGKAFEVETNGLWNELSYPTAFGSGHDIAQHYLRKGSSALVAVREACSTNTTCGGRILTWDFRTRKFHSYAK